MPEIIQSVYKQNFAETVINTKVPVMLVFWSAKYQSCQRLIETMTALAMDYRDSIQFGLVDADDQVELTSQLGIGGLPSVLVLRDGRLCANIGGELPLSYYKDLIDKLLDEITSKRKAFKK